MMPAAACLATRVRAIDRPIAAGVQLFTVDKAMNADPAGTLRQIAQLGYREVETVGAYGLDPVALRAMLDREGLRTPAQHIMPRAVQALFSRRATLPSGVLKQAFLAAFAEDAIDATLDEAVGQALVLGQSYVVWQMLWPEQIDTPDALARTCRLIDRAGLRCHAAGLRFALHNQSHELAQAIGGSAFDAIVARTNPKRVLLDIDMAAFLRAGADPFAALRRVGARCRLVHVRDARDARGRGLSLAAMLAAARAAGVRHAFVDYERLADPFTSLAADRAAFAQSGGPQ